MKAELIVNGPKGFATATVEITEDFKIEAWAAEVALACVLNIYNELPEPKGLPVGQGIV